MSRSEASVVVIGATGLVGSAVRRALDATYDVVATHTSRPGRGTHAYDLARSAPTDLPVAWSRVRALVLAGGVTSLDACAADPAGTREINVQGMLRIARHAMEHGAQVILLSSDTVFDGAPSNRGPRLRTEADPVAPITTYGKQKAEVERALGSDRVTVLRLSKVASVRREDGGFLIDAGRRLMAGESVRCATDQTLNLVGVDDVARVIARLVDDPLDGVWHVAAPPPRTRFEWIASLALALEVPATRVSPSHIAEFETLERLPRDCSLGGSALMNRLGMTLRSGDQLVIDAAENLREKVDSEP